MRSGLPSPLFYGGARATPFWYVESDRKQRQEKQKVVRMYRTKARAGFPNRP